MIECLSTAGADLHVIDEKVMSVKLAKSKGLKCFKAADYTNSNDFVNVDDLLKKYIDLIHKRQKELFKREKRPKQLLHCYRRNWSRWLLLQIKTASKYVEQQLETIAGSGLFERLNSSQAQDWMAASRVEFQPLYNQIGIKSH